MPALTEQYNLQRETLRKLSQKKGVSERVKELAQLRIAYSEDSDILSDYVNKLIHVTRIHPRHLPTQTSARWSTTNPSVTNWARACINPHCQTRLAGLDILQSYGYIEHEWEQHTCWSIRDILLPDSDEILIAWDHDNIEGKIHDLVVNDQEAIQAHRQGLDLHTITCCTIFGYPLPGNLINPHSSIEDAEWRARHNWQGKDTKVRVLAKNFNHGSKYTESYTFVRRMPGVEKYGISYAQLEKLAKQYIASKQHAWDSKLAIMADIRKNRLARSLYGFRRVFYDSSAETGREGFSHMISATVSDYNNETLIMLEDWLGDNVRLLHNAHDGDKIAVKRDCWSESMKGDLAKLIERPITYQDRTLTMTAGIKVYDKA